jgi:long-chain acyl-CoA synthetase
MTLPQFRLLSLVATAPERASKLADRAAVTRPSLTGILDGLVTRGWVERSDVDGDRRGVTLTITAAGQKAYDDATAATAAGLDELIGAADAKTRAKILGGLVALRAVMQDRAEKRVTV